MSCDKIVSDAIFGFITLKPHIVVIIDTPEFQRLRSIWQLGVTPFVYPTADHCRFEHCIGTYWLASKLVTKLKKQLEEENVREEDKISDLDVKCVEIAALCHDLGHGPFSHVWDIKVLPEICGAGTFKHDKQFDKFWGILKENKRVADMIVKESLDEIFIISLINGETGGVARGKKILYEIISNSSSGMDVDKWDYLARDSSYLGHSTTNFRVDIDRMIHLARAIKYKDKYTIAFRESESLNMLRVFQLRHYMYKTAYHHRKVVAIELMFLDGIKDCIDKGILNRNEISTAKWILENTDAIFWSNIKMVPAFEKIVRRELYKPILEATKNETVGDKKLEIVQYLREKHIGDRSLIIDDLRFAFNTVKLGSTDNPMTNIPFYRKNDINAVFKYTDSTLPLHLKMNCDESRLIVFYIGGESYAEIQQNITDYLKDDGWQCENFN